MFFGQDDGSSQSPILGPYMKALSLYQVLHGIKQGEEDRRRKIAQEQRDNDYRERVFKQTQSQQETATRGQQFDDAMKLEDMGADRIMGGPFSDLFRAVVRPRIEKVGDREYVVPTQKQKLERTSRELNVPRQLAGIVGGDKIRVPNSEVMTVLKDFHDIERGIDVQLSPATMKLFGITNGNLRLKPSELPAYVDKFGPQFDKRTDQAGHLNITGYDPVTGQITSNARTASPVYTPGGLTKSGNYTDVQKNRAHLLALGWFKKQYPNGKPTEEFSRAIQAYMADNSVDEATARKRLSSSKRARERYGVSKLYISDPKDDGEYSEKYMQFLEQPGAAAPTAQTKGTPQQKGNSPKAQDQAKRNKVLGQIDRFKQLLAVDPKTGKAQINDGQRAQLEAALIKDLIAAGIVNNEANARAYIQRKLGASR
jgi:hypothetical protein